MNFQDNPFVKNMEQWQELSQTYVENMFATFEKNLHQSKAFQEQVQAAVNKAVDSQFEMVMASLKTVESQVAELSNTLNDLARTQAKEKSK